MSDNNATAEFWYHIFEAYEGYLESGQSEPSEETMFFRRYFKRHEKYPDAVIVDNVSIFHLVFKNWTFTNGRHSVKQRSFATNSKTILERILREKNYNLEVQVSPRVIYFEPWKTNSDDEESYDVPTSRKAILITGPDLNKLMADYLEWKPVPKSLIKPSNSGRN